MVLVGIIDCLRSALLACLCVRAQESSPCFLLVIGFGNFVFIRGKAETVHTYTALTRKKDPREFSSSWGVSSSALKQYWGKYFCMWHSHIPLWTFDPAAISPTKPLSQVEISNTVPDTHTHRCTRAHMAQIRRQSVSIMPAKQRKAIVFLNKTISRLFRTWWYNQRSYE